jgi:hypothetical protein
MSNVAPATLPPSNSQAGAWQLPQCPECGYALQGLPDVGNCPECGEAYDRGWIVLHGIARGNGASIQNGGWRAWAAASFANIYWLAHASDRQMTPLVGLFATFTLVQLILVLLSRWSNSRPGLVRVELEAAGCRQRDEIGWRDGTPYSHVPLWFTCLYPPLYLTGWALTLCLAPKHGLGSLVFLGSALSGLVLGCLMLAYALRRPDRSPGWGKTHPWWQVREVNFLPAKPGHVYLRVRQYTPWWKLENNPIDAEVRCAPEQIEQLKQLIGQWLELAHGAGKNALASA